MICLIALTVFSVLGIFSVRYRKLAKESFDCVFRRVTLRPCESGLHARIRSKIVGKMLKRNVKAASFINKHFELISWIFTIIMIVSLVFSAIGLYNLAVYGSCEPHSTNCVFNPGVLTCGSDHCLEEGCACEDLGCEDPLLIACEGDCECQENICG